MELTRRRMMMNALFGAGWVGLRSLATGIPIAYYLNPKKALAGGGLGAGAQYVIFSTSGSGDPVNANVPGMYTDPLITHPMTPQMTPTNLTLSGVQTKAAAPWANLPQTVLDRTVFFHHGTYTVVHPDERNVMKLMGATVNQEMIPSLLAKQLAPQLGTIQMPPVVLGAETISFQGRAQPSLAPTALGTTLLPPSGPLGQLMALRDRDLDRLNALAKTEGNAAQRSFIDRYAISQVQARQISENLLSTLATITDNSQDSAMTAATILIQMKVAPVITMHINFGGDNHTDVGFANETAQTVSGVATINGLQTKLAAAGLQDKVCFVSLNVFGRTLTTMDGRNHHGDHHCSVLIGAPFKGGIIGGAESANHDYRAMSIDSSTGAGVASGGGDIPFSDTLTSMAKTLGVAAGADPTYLDSNINGNGKVINAALS